MFVGIYFASSFLNVVYESNVKAGPGVDKKAQVADNLVSPLNAQRNGESVFVNFYVVTLIGVSRQFVEDTGLQPDTVLPSDICLVTRPTDIPKGLLSEGSGLNAILPSGVPAVPGRVRQIIAAAMQKMFNFFIRVVLKC